MGFKLEKIVPWGQSYDEYVAMFALTEYELLYKDFLGVGDGPASFNCTLSKRGGRVVSVDPVYVYTKEQISSQIDETYKKVIEETEKNKSTFVWKHIKTVEELGSIRRFAMEMFLDDYEKGLQEFRYIKGALPTLPLKNKEFDIALCSHFLFLYSEKLSEDFHIFSLKELCRVANEVRVFPLLELDSSRSRHLNNVLRLLEKECVLISIEKVSYEFQRGGNEMLRLRRKRF